VGAFVVLMVAVLLASCGCGGGQAPVGSTPTPPADPALAPTAAGTVRGVVTPDHRLFAGIPYAAPPLGPLRFQPPASALPWPGVRDATHPGPRCIQDLSHQPDFGVPTSEDCLTLSVWTPAPERAAGKQLPVMVWIHGGAFVNGSGDIYNSRWLTARGDIIVVTINYRLGALGFLAHPGLGPPGDVGNYGLADQQAALRWVHNNIAGFGGDPAKVTIAGESAGGMSVCDHLVSPASAGLFRAAIIQSGPCQAQADLAGAQKASLDYAKQVGCGDPATAAKCLRSLPPDRLLKPPSYFRIGSDSLTGPVTGTAVLPTSPVSALAAGRAARVPVLIGTNHDEFTLFVAMQYLRLGREFSSIPYRDLLADTFGPDAAAVGQHYPTDRYGGSVPLAYSAAVTDGVFACIADRLADALARTEPVYAYEFNDRGAPAPEPLRTLPFPVGASHSLELRYLFDMGGAPPLNPAQRVLSDQMLAYWTQFVTNGEPRADGQPDWPELGHDPATGPRMSLQPDGSRVVTNFEQAHQCPFWAGIKGAGG
jgi:para-nitrobenzyl esterase